MAPPRVAPPPALETIGCMLSEYIEAIWTRTILVGQGMLLKDASRSGSLEDWIVALR
jgi:hypothetical protein